MSDKKILVLLCAAGAWVIGTCSAFASVTDEQVGDTIDRMKEYLFYKQDPQTGSWEFRSRSGGLASDALQIGGETALVTLALLISGESAQNPKIARAVKFLREVKMKGLYAVAIRAHVWAHLPPDYIPLLEMDASWLINAANRHKLGLFDYQPIPSDRVDHSSTQYGMLGLWEASKRGLRIPNKYWERWVLHFINAQRDDGGWTYSSNPDGITTGSMTAAGLTALYVGQQQLYRDRKTPDQRVTQAITKGLAWLDQRFEGHNNPNANEWTYYYLYGIERVALSSGISYLNGKDWYQTGASHIVQKVQEDDSGGIDDEFVSTAFALMFLSRGRVPVWVNKLQIPGQHWNNYPSDLYSLTHYLSNQIEKEVNWQVISVDLPAEDWLIAPVAYLASHQALVFTEKQKAAVKKYIDLGGLIVANADGGSVQFSDSVRKLAAELYPQYEVKEIPKDHAVFDCWRHVGDANESKRLWGLSNGARLLIILTQSDWSDVFQSDKEPGHGPVWDLATNVFAYATNRGALNNRLVQPFETLMGRAFSGELTVGRARYEGNWLPEPAAWQIQSDYTFNRTGLRVTTTPASGNRVLDLSDIGTCDHKLVHLSGTHAIFLNESERQAIKQYVNRGGTLLIETVGGQGDFSRSLDKQIAGLFDDSYAVPLTASDPIVSGHGLEGGQDNRRALYRRCAVVTMHFEPRPYLAAYLDASGRPMVIISHEDLSLGMIGSRHWDIIGYQPTTARNLMTNISLWAQQQRLVK